MIKNIKINSSNVNHYNCISCGKELTKKEYYNCDDLCNECRRKHYGSIHRDFTDRYGQNKVDEILINKRKGK